MDTSQIEVNRTRPRVHLSSVTHADASAMARLFLLAFQPSEYTPALTPHIVGLTTAELLSRYGPLEERRLRRGLVGKSLYIKASVLAADDAGTERETIVGWAKWDAPPGVRRRSVLEWLWCEILYPIHQFVFRPAIARGLPDAAKALFASQYADTFGPGGMVAAGRNRWYLSIICVDPAWQRAGAGGALLEWGMEKARETNAVVYLETSPAGRPLYVAKGFRVASERPGMVNGILIALPGMIWEPQFASRV